MSDQAAGLRAWHQQHDNATLLVLGRPEPVALERALARLPSPGGKGWQAVGLTQAPGRTPSYALLWLDAWQADITADYRQLKRMTVEVGRLPTLLWLDGGDGEAAARLDKLGMAARRFLGVELIRNPRTWLARGAV